ncbi:MAG: hypothetical protein V7K35_07145 [Nostoc sp.]|uniref:hypothetical protein n=1 Tax=Nostoc sp. TaxID=1180 RepID=UPI002FF7F63D
MTLIHTPIEQRRSFGEAVLEGFPQEELPLVQRKTFELPLERRRSVTRRVELPI